MITSQHIGLKAAILDTETHTIDGLPIEIAFGGCDIQNGTLYFDKSNVFDQYYSIGDTKMSIGAMAVHHIVESDLVGMPDYKKFKLPSEVEYIIGHNIQYDITAITKCEVDTSSLKPICTLSMARHLWPDLETHKLEALIYFVFDGSAAARDLLKNAHCASVDIELTAILLERIIQEADIQNIEQLYQFSQQSKIWRKIYFGKHRGEDIKDLPVSYVQWLLRQPDLNPDLEAGIYKFHPNFLTSGT